MSDLTITGPAGDESGKTESCGTAGGAQAADGSARKGEGKTLDEDTCLQGLAQMPGLVALKLLGPAQANSIRAIYHEALQYHQKVQARDDRKVLSNDDVLELMRLDPKIINLLGAILTDEQVAMLMEAKASDGG